MRVICLHRVPAFVVPLHLTVLASPLAFLLDTRFDRLSTGGRQILHGCKPNSAALEKVISSETLFTIRQDSK